MEKKRWDRHISMPRAAQYATMRFSWRVAMDAGHHAEVIHQRFALPALQSCGEPRVAASGRSRRNFQTSESQRLRVKIKTGSQMKRPSIITTPMPTPEETAKLLGISKKDAKFIEALVEKWAFSPETVNRYGEPRNGQSTTTKRKKAAVKRGP